MLKANTMGQLKTNPHQQNQNLAIYRDEQEQKKQHPAIDKLTIKLLKLLWIKDVGHLRGEAEDLLNQLLSLRWLLEEQLDDGSQQSELDLQIKAYILICSE